jgi:alpha-tubulin suppressor-like RCC1 family protein
VFAWGFNNYGQLGVSNKGNVNIPVEVEHLKGHRIVSIACGEYHSMVLSGIDLLLEMKRVNTQLTLFP